MPVLDTSSQRSSSVASDDEFTDFFEKTSGDEEVQRFDPFGDSCFKVCDLEEIHKINFTWDETDEAFVF